MNDQEFQQAFDMLPSGESKLGTRVLEVGERAAIRMGTEHPILMFVLTDGEMDDKQQALFEKNIDTLMHKKHHANGHFHLQLMACTNDSESTEWLSHLEYRFEAVDCIDDYQVELAQVMKAKKTTTFTRGDWVLKAMLGPISRKHDNLDEGGLLGGLAELTHSGHICSCCGALFGGHH